MPLEGVGKSFLLILEVLIVSEIEASARKIDIHDQKSRLCVKGALDQIGEQPQRHYWWLAPL